MIPGARTFIIGLPRLVKREGTLTHLAERGISAEKFDAVDYEVTGLCTRFPYEVDNPGSGFNIGPKLVNLYLAHYLLWNVCLHLENDSFFIFEDDVRFDADWKTHFDDAIGFLPDDWDLLYVGSCCVEHNRERRQVHNRLWMVRYALCTHAYAIRKKAIRPLLDGLQKVYAPVDIAMITEAKLKMYAFFPRLCDQDGIEILP